MESNFLQAALSQSTTAIQIVDLLNCILPFKSDCLDRPDADAVTSLILTEHSDGFPLDFCLFWPADVMMEVSHSDVGLFLAKSFASEVLVDLGNIEDQWLLAKPDGSIKQVEIEDLRDGFTYREIPGT